MSIPLEIAAARGDVQRTRDQLSDTISELEDLITAPVRAVKHRLDVGRLVREHPLTAVAVALGTGALVASAGADERAAALAVQTAKQGSEKVKQGGAAGIRLTREVPARARGAVSGAVDALGARIALALIDALRAPRVASLPPAPHAGLGFVDNAAPAHESETP